MTADSIPLLGPNNRQNPDYARENHTKLPRSAMSRSRIGLSSFGGLIVPPIGNTALSDLDDSPYWTSSSTSQIATQTAAGVISANKTVRLNQADDASGFVDNFGIRRITDTCYGSWRMPSDGTEYWLTSLEGGMIFVGPPSSTNPGWSSIASFLAGSASQDDKDAVDYAARSFGYIT